MLTKTEEIRTFILENVEKHPKDIVKVASQHFDITRQAVSRHLSALIDEDLLEAHGKTKGRTYELKILLTNVVEVPLSVNSDEDALWGEHVRPFLSDVKQNVHAICHHGFTEMMNNAIDHSEGTTVEILVIRTAVGIDLSVRDDGVGIFSKIARELKLPDKHFAILELAKGKFTTDPKKHTGEGIFFTSRMFDNFWILSDDLSLVHDERLGDWLLDGEKEPLDGTCVMMRIDPHSNRDILQVFDQFSDPEDFSFSKTRVPVKLAQFGEENLISRSQAKRVLTRFDRFKKVILDFSGVEMIGQAFADEIFRVFRREHPDVELSQINANSVVERMVLRALQGTTSGEKTQKE